LGGKPEGKERGFRLKAEEANLKETPLSLFLTAEGRRGLEGVLVERYLRVEVPARSEARVLFSFEGTGEPAVVTWKRHRGRCVVVTTTANREWTNLPYLPSYVPFVHEAARFAARGTAWPAELRVGEPLEVVLPGASPGGSFRVVL